MKKVSLFILTIMTSIFLFLPVFAGERIILSANSVTEGDGYSWDNGILTLNNYNGNPFYASGPLTVILNGKNKINAGPNGFGIETDNTLVIEGNGLGSLEIHADQAGGIHAYGNVEIRNAGLDILSDSFTGGIGIMAGLSDQDDQNGHLLFDNVSGNITASGNGQEAGEQSEAVFSMIPIEFKNTVVDKKTGMLQDDDEGNEYTFVNGNTTVFRSYAKYRDETAGRVIFIGSTVKSEKPLNIIVKGETLDLRELYPVENNQKYTFQTRKMKNTAGIRNNWALTGKKKGDVVIIVKDPDNPEGPILWETTVTILKKPKLKFPKIVYKFGEEIDAKDFFITEDTEFIKADSWTSSDPEVAEISNTGIITVNGIGKTKICAYFGNVKITGTLKVL